MICRIRLTLGETIAVHATETGLPGLVATYRDHEDGVQGPGWALTHLRSGISVVAVRWKTEADALEAAHFFLGIDFTRPAEELLNDRWLIDGIRFLWRYFDTLRVADPVGVARGDAGDLPAEEDVS